MLIQDISDLNIVKADKKVLKVPQQKASSEETDEPIMQGKLRKHLKTNTLRG